MMLLLVLPSYYLSKIGFLAAVSGFGILRDAGNCQRFNWHSTGLSNKRPRGLIVINKAATGRAMGIIRSDFFIRNYLSIQCRKLQIQSYFKPTADN